MNQLPKVVFRYQLTHSDQDLVRQIACSSGFFRTDEVDVAVELVGEVLAKGAGSGYFFIFAMLGDKTAGFACFGPVPCTIGSYDLYWIAVDDSFRKQGIGKKILLQVEQEVKKMNGRQVYIETSSTDKYLPTRKFYIAAGYHEAARLQDFYLQGDHKVIYVKKVI